MITLWSVWLNGEWLGCGEPRVFSAREDAHYLAESLAEGDPDAFRDCEARLYGQFVQVPPEVVAAVNKLLPHTHWVNVAIFDPHCKAILNWAIKALAAAPEVAEGDKWEEQHETQSGD